MIKTLLKNRSLQVLFIVAIYLTIAPFFSLEVHRGLYALSLFIKDLLLWMLPATVCFFIGHAIFSFEKKAPLFILTLFLFEAASNTMSVWYSYGCGSIAAHFLQAPEAVSFESAFEPLWRLSFVRPGWWTADKGSFLGLALGLAAAFKAPYVRSFILQGKRIAGTVLTQVFSRLIPLFILGFVARMRQTQLLDRMLSHYADFLLWLVFILSAYILFLFLLGTGFSRRAFFQNIKNLLPATGMALSSGCSLSTMPWTIEGAAKNLKNPDLAKAVIPATTNIQQVGDCLANTFLCFLLYRQFHGVSPDIATWLIFSAVFVLARFATAAVLGGAIFIMLPIYEHYLHFTPEMNAIVLAFNVVLDPLITCANVTGNGALCRVFERAWSWVSQRAIYTIYQK